MPTLEKESSKINNLSFQCKKQEVREKLISKASRRELIKSRNKEIKNRNTVGKKINKINGWYLKSINKIDKSDVLWEKRVQINKRREKKRGYHYRSDRH